MRARLLFFVCVGGILSALIGCQPNCSDLVFPLPADSPYLLPYPVGESYLVSQSYCNPHGGHRNRIAVDFKMPLGAQITASRGGEVVSVVEGFADGDLQRGHNNRLLIRHPDRSIAWYGHLKKDSIVVDVGDMVVAGQPVAECGNTGNTGNLPHLHFEVFRRRAYVYSDAIPITFRNARGELDAKGGMVAGRSYEALGEEP